jgi:hypothetical protein
MDRVVIVGGGALGLMHAVSARRRGLDVVHLEREPGPRGATVRNFGLVWVSGRAGGPELDLALRARELWEQLGAEVPAAGFRPHGSLTLAAGEAELALLKEAAARPDAARRGYELLDPAAAREVNPALRGAFAGALLCRRDAIVEPRLVPGAIRDHLRAAGAGRGPGYDWRPGREAVEVTPYAVRDHTGDWRTTITSAAARSSCSGPRCRRPGAGGPASTARSRRPSCITGPRSRRAWSW